MINIFDASRNIAYHFSYCVESLCSGPHDRHRKSTVFDSGIMEPGWPFCCGRSWPPAMPDDMRGHVVGIHSAQTR